MRPQTNLPGEGTSRLTINTILNEKTISDSSRVTTKQRSFENVMSDALEMNKKESEK